ARSCDIEIRDRFTVSTAASHWLKKTKPKACNRDLGGRIVSDHGRKPVLVEIRYLAVIRDFVVRRPIAVGILLGVCVDQRPHRRTGRLRAGKKVVDDEVEIGHQTPNERITVTRPWGRINYNWSAIAVGCSDGLSYSF